MKKILVINGPNLNLLGEREPGIYGDDTYESLCSQIMDKADNMEIKCEIFQSNHEGAIIDKLHAARINCAGVILNAGAYTHYSYALRDAIAAIDIPVAEVHMSNVYAREAFRRTSVLSEVCAGTVCGFGAGSYLAAMLGLKDRLSK
jgi:3-dehydroquinate dehydratase-2